MIKNTFILSQGKEKDNLEDDLGNEVTGFGDEAMSDETFGDEDMGGEDTFDDGEYEDETADFGTTDTGEDMGLGEDDLTDGEVMFFDNDTNKITVRVPNKPELVFELDYEEGEDGDIFLINTSLSDYNPETVQGGVFPDGTNEVFKLGSVSSFDIDKMKDTIKEVVERIKTGGGVGSDEESQELVEDNFGGLDENDEEEALGEDEEVVEDGDEFGMDTGAESGMDTTGEGDTAETENEKRKKLGQSLKQVKSDLNKVMSEQSWTPEEIQGLITQVSDYSKTASNFSSPQGLKQFADKYGYKFNPSTNQIEKQEGANQTITTGGATMKDSVYASKKGVNPFAVAKEKVKEDGLDAEKSKGKKKAKEVARATKEDQGKKEK